MWAVVFNPGFTVSFHCTVMELAYLSSFPHLGLLRPAEPAWAFLCIWLAD